MKPPELCDNTIAFFKKQKQQQKLEQKQEEKTATTDVNSGCKPAKTKIDIFKLKQILQQSENVINSDVAPIMVQATYPGQD